MKYKKFLSCSLLAGAAILTWGCEKDDICPESTPGTPSAKVVFYTYDAAGVPVEYIPTGLHFYGLEGKERLEEITLPAGAKDLGLPVDFEAEESRYLIEMEGVDQTDTLTLRYTPELEFISKACGFRFVFSDVTVDCTAQGPVLSIVKDIEQSPADGRLFNSLQTTATLYFRTE